VARGLLKLIRSDLERFAETYRLRGQRFSKARVLFESVLFKPGFQAVLLYRLSHWLHQHGCTYLAWATARFGQFLTGAEIEFNAEIGPGLFIAHPGGVVVGRGTRLGRHATLFQGVTFGAHSWHPREIRRFPTAGDHCFFCANAVVLGGIRIGDDCVVAAGAMLDRDLPAGGLAKGVPAVLVPDQGRALLQSWGLIPPERDPKDDGSPAWTALPDQHELIGVDQNRRPQPARSRELSTLGRR
jgi:serine O-acetyltransferase